MKGICPNCGKECKNLGSHLRFCQKGDKIKVDNYIPEQPLSSIISEIREILKRYQHQLQVKTTERDGRTEEVEIIARFQIRR